MGEYRVRIKWIDTMKVIGMYFIVLGHMFPQGYKSIYAFSVPLFFFLSGLLSRKESDSRIFWNKVIRTLLIPMICFCFLSLLYNIVRYRIPLIEVISNGHIWLFRVLTGCQTAFNVGGYFPGTKCLLVSLYTNYC